MHPIEFGRAYSLHENSVMEMKYDPSTAELRLALEEAITGSDGHRTIVIEGVKHLCFSGSTAAGVPGLVPGDEILSLQVEAASGFPPEHFRLRILIDPTPQLVRPETALNVLEVVALNIRVL